MRGAMRGLRPLLEPPGEKPKRTVTAALAADSIRGSPLFEPEPQSRRPVATATLREDTDPNVGSIFWCWADRGVGAVWARPGERLRCGYGAFETDRWCDWLAVV
jgi:hypothetical protein